MIRRCALAMVLAAWLGFGDAEAARLPPGLPVEVTYTDPKTKKNVTLVGEMVFDAIPATVEGKPSPIDKSAMLATQYNPASLTRIDEKRFLVKTFKSQVQVELGVESIPVKKAVAEQIRGAIDVGAGGLAPAATDDLLEPEQRNAPPPPLVLGVPDKPSLDVLPVKLIQVIQFKPPETMDLDVGGRFVAYSKRVKGSGGTVQVKAATFFGGPASDGFVGGAFLKDGTIVAAGTFSDLGFAAGVPQDVVGNDPPQRRPPPPTPAPTTRSRREVIVDPNSAATIVRYSPDLGQVRGITRLPWGSTVAGQLRSSPSGAIFLGGMTLGGADVLPGVKAATVKAPEGATSTRGSFVARLADDGRSLQWLVHFSGRNINWGIRPNDELMVVSHAEAWFVGADGQVREGPKLTLRRGRFYVSPLDGAYYFGGDYHSGTGFEPYRNPYLHKMDETGKVLWTAWDWTGPMVGVYFRQVSDSAVRGLKFARNGDLLMVGWSDGGNTVFTNAPYDLEVSHGKYGFLRDMSAAGVGSFCHLLRMDGRTMEVKGATYWISYMPYKEKMGRPNSASASDVVELGDGRWAMAGSSAFALIETPDAWVTPWVVQQEKDPATARPHGGSCFVVFDPEFKEMEFSSLTPLVNNQQLAVRGTRVLLTGSVAESGNVYGSDMKPILVSPRQERFGGGATDGYVMLIETRGEATLK